MGNSTGNGDKAYLQDFQMQKYLNQGLNQKQILQIREAFQSYEPENGEVTIDKLRFATDQPEGRELISKYLGNKQSMNFDEFFAMSKDLLKQEMAKHPGMVIDTDEVEASCLFCPYAIDRKH